MGDQQRCEEPETGTGGDCTRAGVVVSAVSASERPFGTRTDELAKKVVHPGWAITVTGADQVMPRLHEWAVPTRHVTGRLVDAGRKCTVTLTGQSAPGAQLPVLCIATPVIAPACR
jgi:hypothetical protein